LSELYVQFGLKERGVLSEPDFLQTFYTINNELWDLYDRGLLHRDVIRKERFHRILLTHGVDDYEMSLKISGEYLEHSPKKKNLIEGCKETLDYLQPKYRMIIVTNGFDEIQSTKLSSSGIIHYFKDIVTSARAGHKKPRCAKTILPRTKRLWLAIICSPIWRAPGMQPWILFFSILPK